MPDEHPCPATHCGRPMRRGDVLCHRCWYVLADDLKQAYRAALAAAKASRTGRNMQALLVAKTRILDSINPKGTPHGSDYQT